MRGVAQYHLGHHLRLREGEQVFAHVLAPVDKRRFLDVLKLRIRVFAEHDFAKGERVERTLERRFLPLAALYDEGDNPGFLREGLHYPAGVAVGVAVQDYGTGLDHRRERRDERD